MKKWIMDKIFNKNAGTYMAVKYSHLTNLLIHRWCEVTKIPNIMPAHELHSTVIHSKVKIPKEFHLNVPENSPFIVGWRFEPDRLDVFKGFDGKRKLVLRIIAPELVELHTRMIAAGGTHDFETYDPHITISTDFPETFDVTRLPLPPVFLLPVSIYTETLQ